MFATTWAPPMPWSHEPMVPSRWLGNRFVTISARKDLRYRSRNMVSIARGLYHVLWSYVLHRRHRPFLAIWPSPLSGGTTHEGQPSLVYNWMHWVFFRLQNMCSFRAPPHLYRMYWTRVIFTSERTCVVPSSRTSVLLVTFARGRDRGLFCGKIHRCRILIPYCIAGYVRHITENYDGLSKWCVIVAVLGSLLDGSTAFERRTSPYHCPHIS